MFDAVIRTLRQPNNSLCANRRLHFVFGGFGIFGLWSCSKRLSPATRHESSGRATMLKQAIILFLSMLMCSSSLAQESKFLGGLSPRLRKLLAGHPAAMKTLTSALSDAFSSKTYGVYYFYSDDKSDAKAFHFYPEKAGLPEVMVCVRENQTPLDEFTTMLFETLNAKGENRFAKLCENARAGTISRAEFAREILRVEFEAVKNTRDLLATLKFRKKEMAEAHSYDRLMHCPGKFEDYLSYLQMDSHNRDVIKEYELKYDSMRKMSSGPDEPR